MSHNYGPHDPTAAPVTVVVGRPGKWAGEHEVPIHPAILRQREQLNNIAAGLAAKAEGQARAEAAHPAEVAKVEAVIRRFAGTGRPFSANEIRPLHGVRGGAVGKAFTNMKNEGVIKPCGDETSTDKGTHGHRIFQWVAA